MTKIDLVFYGSAILCVLSFLLFAGQVIAQSKKLAAGKASGGLGEARMQAFDVKESLEEMGKLVQTFAKAGPIATCAGLTVFFALISVVSSGLIEIKP
jgi:hypothetical protein